MADGKANRLTLTDDELAQIARLVSKEMDRVTNLAFMEPVDNKRIEAARWWRSLANRLNARVNDNTP